MQSYTWLTAKESETMRVKPDKESVNYADTGCPDGLYPSCLNCPLSRCRYDVGGLGRGIRACLAEEKAKVVQALWLEEELTRQEIASRLGVSRDTVGRYLRRHSKEE